MSYADVQMKIIQWAEARKIIPNSSAETQLLKAVSELGELADATIKKEPKKIRDGVGDVMVCLVNYCALQDIANTIPNHLRFFFDGRIVKLSNFGYGF